MPYTREEVESGKALASCFREGNPWVARLRVIYGWHSNWKAVGRALEARGSNYQTCRAILAEYAEIYRQLPRLEEA